MHGSGVSGAEEQFTVKLGNRVRLRENDFETIRKPRPGPLRPRHRTFGGKSRNADCYLHSTGSHYAASFALRGVRKTMARFSFRRYFFATARISSRVTERNPSRIVFTNCRSWSKSVKQARRCINPYFGMYPPRPPSSVA